MRLSEEFLAELRSRNDIEEVIGRYVELSNRGSSTPKGLCPFHSEKTASFTVYNKTQSFYCFGCQTGGDVIRFVMNIERLDYMEAVKTLCERSGLALPEENRDDRALQTKRRCYAANREAARFFYSVLSTPAGKAGSDYFAQRKLTKETITHFGLGFAPDSWDSLVKHLKSKGFNENELVAFDLAQKTKNGGCIDRFRNRVMFPILDIRGNVIGFTGRILDSKGERKYMNTSDTVVYKKSREIFALNFAKNANNGKLLLCEGNMDVIMMHQNGFTNAVAAMGTAFTMEQVNLLSRYCDEITLCFDNDAAGVKATKKALELLNNAPMKIRVVKLDGGKDADEILKTRGREYLSRLIDGASNNTEFLLLQAKANCDINSEDGKLAYLNEAVKIIASIKNSIESNIYTRTVANETGVATAAVEAQIKKIRKSNIRKQNSQFFETAVQKLTGDPKMSPNPDVKRYPRAVMAEETLLATLLKAPDFLRKLGNSLSADTFMTELNKRIFTDIASRIEQQRMIDISVFSSDDDGSDLAYMSYLFAKSETVTCSISECDECIKILVFEKNNNSQTSLGGMSAAQKKEALRDMSNEDFLAAFNKAIENSNNNGGL